MAFKIAFDVGFRAAEKVHVTKKMVHQFAEMCGDFNPMHFDEEYAKTTRFGRPIAHGMITGALFSRVLNDNMGAGGIYVAQNMKFLAPIYIDETVTIELHVMQMRKERGIASVETIARKENGEIAVKGEAIIMIADMVQKKES